LHDASMPYLCFVLRNSAVLHIDILSLIIPPRRSSDTLKSAAVLFSLARAVQSYNDPWRADNADETDSRRADSEGSATLPESDDAWRSSPPGAAHPRAAL